MAQRCPSFWSATQIPHYVHRELEKVLGLSRSHIRVIATPNGGAFGGKSDPFAHEFAACLLSMRTKRRLVSIIATLAGAERGAVIAREALGPNGQEVERVLVYTVKYGLLHECWVYDADQRFVDELVGV